MVAYVRFRQELAGISEDAVRFPIVAPLCPWIVIASICIFTGFSLLDIRLNHSKLASYTFYIYLIHVGVWDVLARVIWKCFGSNGDSRILIPFSILTVFVLSLVLIVAWKRLRKRG